MIVVTGPGRCGTSATAQAILDLEPALAVPPDPPEANDYNPGGYTGESVSLNAFCIDRVHPWAHRDELGEWWTRAPRDLAQDAQGITDRLWPGVPWQTRMVKAPVLSLSLPWFAHTVWAGKITAVVTSVRPLPEHAESARRFQPDPTLAAEAAERALRCWGNVARTCGRFRIPLIVSSYEELTDAPGAWQARMTRDLAQLTGLPFTGTIQSVRPEWRHRCA